MGSLVNLKLSYVMAGGLQLIKVMRKADRYKY